MSSPAQKLLADLAQRAGAVHFGATPLPHKTLTKNPAGRVAELDAPLRRRTVAPSGGLMHEMHNGSDYVWHTLRGAQAVELRELVATLSGHIAEMPRPKRPRTAKHDRPAPSELGRNCSLFDRLRYYAYDNNVSSDEELYREAQALNADGLADSELRAVARSIAKFMRTRFRPASR
ncbi:primase C-terminal domain-containing protein, partial [Acetobacter pasteurianus]|uniref:primase C-terminal domain-containing protein n=1 Tax=Acetobacter pasteurianus TaxID=438 RepID=UPI00216B502C